MLQELLISGPERKEVVMAETTREKAQRRMTIDPRLKRRSVSVSRTSMGPLPDDLR